MPPAGHRTAAALALWLLCALFGLHGVRSDQPLRPFAGGPAGLTGVGGGMPDLLAARDPLRAVFGRPVVDPRSAKPWSDGPSAAVVAPLPPFPTDGGPLRHRGVADNHAPAVSAHAFEARAPPRPAA